MGWFSELFTAFQALGALEQTAWVVGTLIPIVGVFFALRRFFAADRNDEKTHPQSNPVNIHLPAPVEKRRTEGQIIGDILDLEDDAKSRVLETINKLAEQTPEPGETKEEITEAVEEARAGDLTDIRALLNSRYQKFAAEHGGAAKNLAEAARDLAAVEFPDNKRRALALYRQATELEPDDFWSWINLGRSARDCGDLNDAMKAFDSASKVAASEIAMADIFLKLGNLGEGEQRNIAANEAMTRRADAAPEDLQRQRDLSVSHNKIGEVRMAQGNLPGALTAYRASLAIDEKLTAADPGNAEWQRDLLTANVKLADTGDQPGKRLTRALEIAQALRDTDRLNPADHWMMDDLKKRIADQPDI